MFNYCLHHVPSACLGKTDTLLRIDQDAANEGRELPEEEILLPSEVFIQAIQHIEILNNNIRQYILNCKANDKAANHGLCLVLRNTQSSDKCTPPNWDIKDDLLIFRGQVYIPKDTEL